jgi:hypothetical protein
VLPRVVRDARDRSKKALKVLGREEAVIGILQALAKSITANRRKRRAA